MRALFFNEGDVDTHVLGHGRLGVLLAHPREAIERHRAGQRCSAADAMARAATG